MAPPPSQGTFPKSRWCFCGGQENDNARAPHSRNYVQYLACQFRGRSHSRLDDGPFAWLTPRPSQGVEPSHDQAHFSAQQHEPPAHARLSQAYGNQRRPEGAQEPPSSRSLAPDGICLSKVVLVAFGRHQRIRKRSEYNDLMRRGLRVPTDHFLFVLAVRFDALVPPGPRLGLVVSRKVGCAVTRNRMKRLAREAYRATFSLWPDDAELIVVARRFEPTLRCQDIESEWRRAEPRILSALSRLRTRGPEPQTGGGPS